MVARYRPRAYTRHHLRSWARDLRALRRGGFDVQHSLDFSTVPSEAMASRLVARRFTFTLRNTGFGGSLGSLRAKVAIADRVVSISPATDQVLAWTRVPNGKIRRIPNGLELPLRTETSLGLCSPYVACVGSLVANKRQHDAVEILHELASRRPDLQLVLVGNPDVDPGYSRHLRRAIADRGLEDRVHLVGERCDVPGIMAGAEAVLITSETEGLSTVMLEALAVGTPLVCTELAGSEPVRDVSGQFAVGEVAAAAELLLGTTAPGPERDDRSRRGRRLIDEVFHAERMAADYARLFDAVVAARRWSAGL